MPPAMMIGVFTCCPESENVRDPSLDVWFYLQARRFSITVLFTPQFTVMGVSEVTSNPPR